MLVLFYYVGMKQFFFGVPEILVDLIRDPVDPRSLSKKLRSPGSRLSGSPVIRSAARTEACPLQSSLGWIIGVMICRSLTLASVPGVASGKCESLKAKGFFDLVHHWCSDGPLLDPLFMGQLLASYWEIICRLDLLDWCLVPQPDRWECCPAMNREQTGYRVV